MTVIAAPTASRPAGPLQSGESGPVGTLVLPDHANAPLADQLVRLVPGGTETSTTYTNAAGTTCSTTNRAAHDASGSRA